MIRLSLFGSQLKGSASDDSDVDLLVEFDPEHIPSLLDIAVMEDELSAAIGKRVDLRTAGDLSEYFRDDVVRVAEVQYARDGDEALAKLARDRLGELKSGAVEGVSWSDIKNGARS